MSKSRKPKSLCQIEDCMNSGSFNVNDAGELVMTHPERFTKSEINLLKLYFSKKIESGTRSALEQ